MIVVRTPFRISFAGGGSDLRAFYATQPGCVVSAAINKYMYVMTHPHHEGKWLIKYSRTELVDNPAEINHAIVRGAIQEHLRAHRFVEPLDINFTADVPAGTGLGSSCSFTVGLIHALRVTCCPGVTQKELAKDAAALGMDILCDPIGKQDSYAAAFGGLNFFVFSPDEEVTVERLEIPESLNLRLLMFRIGAPHDSHEILRDQVSRPNHASVAKMAKLAQELRESIIAGRIEDFGPILHENWMLKKELSPLISNTWVDVNYRRALDAGATGGKLLGAGGGGYLLVYCEPTHSEEVIRALSHLTRLYYSFDTLGTRAIVWE